MHQSLALILHRWGTTSQGSQSPLAEQLLESHVHQYAATFSAQAPTISWRICTCLRIRVAYRCTYGGVYSSSHRRLKESNGRRRRREGRTRPLAAPQRLISSSWGVGFQGYNQFTDTLAINHSSINLLINLLQRLVSRKVTVKKNTFCMEENSTIWFLVPQGWCFSWKKSCWKIGLGKDKLWL